jgi:hypothetical protein
MRLRFSLILLGLVILNGCAQQQYVQRPLGMGKATITSDPSGATIYVKKGEAIIGWKTAEPWFMVGKTPGSFDSLWQKDYVKVVWHNGQESEERDSPRDPWGWSKYSLHFVGKAQVAFINKTDELPSPQHVKEPTNYASNTPGSKIVIPSPEISREDPEKEEKQVSLKVSTLETEKNTGNDLPSIQFGRYHALIIGNNDYESLPKLKTAKNDSQTVANILKNDYGFNVILLLDAKRSDTLLALSKLRESLTNQDNLLIYYAGHGWLDKEGDEGYWLPVDATRDNEINWISNTSITTQLKAMEAKHVLIVADSCYSGKLGRSVLIQKRTPDYYSRLAQKRARIVIASGGLEPTIDSGGKGNHSVFASAFIEALQENQNFIDTSDLFNKIRRPVMLNADQTPEYADIRKAGHDGGEFIFIRKK